MLAHHESESGEDHDGGAHRAQSLPPSETAAGGFMLFSADAACLATEDDKPIPDYNETIQSTIKAEHCTTLTLNTQHARDQILVYAARTWLLGSSLGAC